MRRKGLEEGDLQDIVGVEAASPASWNRQASTQFGFELAKQILDVLHLTLCCPGDLV